MVQQAAAKKASSPKTASRTPMRASLRAMLLVDSGEPARAKAVLETEFASGKKDPYRETLRAEVALYYDHLDEAEELLRKAVSQLSGVRSVTRWILARARLHSGRQEYDQARDLFRGALSNCRYLADRYGMALALFNLGQLERLLEKYDEAESLLIEAQSHVDDKGRRGDFLGGLIAYNLGICKQQQSFLDESQHWYETSLSLLLKTGKGRYYCLALSGYGTLLEDREQYDMALEALEEAATVAELEGTPADVAVIRWNLGRCLYHARKWELAEVVLRQAQELNSQIGNLSGTCEVLQLLTELHLEQNAIDKAEQCANESLAQAEEAKDEVHLISGEIALARMHILRGRKEEAQKLLLGALERADQLESDLLRAGCLMYLAECCMANRASEAQSYLQQAEAFLQGTVEPKLIHEFERISHKARHARIRVTEEGDLIINKSFLPRWGEAKEAVESFLIKHALQQSDDNNTRAAKILSISKVHLCEKRKQYKL